MRRRKAQSETMRIAELENQLEDARRAAGAADGRSTTAFATVDRLRDRIDQLQTKLVQNAAPRVHLTVNVAEGGTANFHNLAHSGQ